MFSSGTVEDGYYYWRVRSVDNCNNNGDWSSIRRLKYDINPPTSFSLIDPLGYSSDNTPDYTWQLSNDASFENYKLYINSSIRTTLTDTVFSEPSAVSDGQYIWYVVACDSFGRTTQSNEIDTLIIDVTPPNAISLSYPTHNSFINNCDLFWHEGYDNYSGIKHYLLEYDDNISFTSPDSVITSDTSAAFSIPEGQYYWRVRAIDYCDNEGSYSVIWSFELDSTLPATPTLVYPIGSELVEDSNITFDWTEVTNKMLSELKDYNVGDGTDAASVSYIIQIDTINTFGLPVIIDTASTDSISMVIWDDNTYYWRIKAYDEAGNEAPWSSISSFILNIPIAKFASSYDSYDFGDIEVNREYTWSDLYFYNTGDVDLHIDSTTINENAVNIDTLYTYPVTLIPNDSINYNINILSADTGSINGIMKIFHDVPGIVYDSILIYAYCGVPTVIDSAKAFDGTNVAAGIDDDDFVVLYFNQNTNGPVIDKNNINTLLRLSNGHSWLDGFGELGTTTWNGNKNILMIELTTNISAPSIAPGDTIYPDSSSIIGNMNGFVCHYPVDIIGNFGLTGIANKELINGGIAEDKSFLDVSVNKVGYRVINPSNSVKIYDITGKLIINIEDKNPGNYILNTKNISSGIYFIIMKDGDEELNGRLTVIK